MDRSKWQRRLETLEEEAGLIEGFQLLFCPWASIGHCEVAFLSENPGAASVHTPRRVVSDERGNSYEVEREFTLSPLTAQFLLMCNFLKIAPAKVLAGVANPFRSPRRENLTRSQMDAGLSVGREFWAEAFIFNPVARVIVCGQVAADMATEIFEAEVVKQIPSGWGAVKLRRYEGRDGTAIIQLPHLSSYKLFSRPDCREPLTAIFADGG